LSAKSKRGDRPLYKWVDTTYDLKRVAADLERSKAMGVDLEADSMFHYREKVCLVQISTRLETFLIDPLAMRDLKPLSPVFKDKTVRKIFHGADYDLRSLYRDFMIEVEPLFDTQIAARFLGIRETGLANLLRDRLGVVTDKKYQKKDWSVRPLPEPMLEYGAMDSSYLIPLAGVLESELRKRGRLQWVEEECEIQSRVRPVPAAGYPLFQKFRGAGKLDPRGLAVLEKILRFREKVAMRRDRPPFKVMGNGPVMDMAVIRPRKEEALRKIKGLSPRQVKSLGPSLLREIETAMRLHENDLPIYPRKRRQRHDHRVMARVKALKQWREERSRKLEIDPALVCSNSLVHTLAVENLKAVNQLEGVEDMRGWQRQEFGNEIFAVLKSATP
jgi:ribonuclease D